MKKYIKPAIEIVELESNQRMSDTSPVKAVTSSDGNTVTTVYNLALVKSTSYNAD